MKLLLVLGAALAASLGTSSYIDSGYPPARYQGDTSAETVTFLTDQAAIDLLCGKAPTASTR